MISSEEQHPVILFDGYCNFCSRSIDFILKNDRKNKFMFAASQSEAGKKLIQKYQLVTVDSVILIDDGKAYLYSTAVLKIIKSLSFPLKIFSILIIVPEILRDPIYKWIAKNRFRWFGKRITCRVPNPEEKERFLQ